jgi:hypothetical protein
MPGEQNYNDRLEANENSITQITEQIRMYEKSPHFLNFTTGDLEKIFLILPSLNFRMMIDFSIGLLNEWKKLSLKEESHQTLQAKLNALEYVSEQKIIIKGKKKTKRLAHNQGRFLPYDHPQAQHSQHLQGQVQPQHPQGQAQHPQHLQGQAQHEAITKEMKKMVIEDISETME